MRPLRTTTDAFVQVNVKPRVQPHMPLSSAAAIEARTIASGSALIIDIPLVNRHLLLRSRHLAVAQSYSSTWICVRADGAGLDLLS